MIIIRNKIIPFPGYKSINLCGILFVKEKAVLDEKTLNHEAIHSKQILEMLVIFFYLWYIIEWLIRLIQYRNTDEAYKHVSFEKESYLFEHNKGYLDWRPWFNWRKFL